MGVGHRRLNYLCTYTNSYDVHVSRIRPTYLPIIIIFFIILYYNVTAVLQQQQHNAFPFQRFGRIFSVVIVIFYGSVFRRLSGGDAHCTGATNRGRRRNAERAGLRSSRSVPTLFGPRLLTVSLAVHECFVFPEIFGRP